MHVLPYFGYQSLYNQFHLNEPWNSANNLPLASKMPDIFREPGDASDSTTTQFQIISGEGAPYYWRRSAGLLIGPTTSNITDGLQNTFLVVETGADKAVGWTKPDATSFDPLNPLASLGTLPSGKFHAIMADITTITLSASIAPATFTSLVTVSGGEVENADALGRQYVKDTSGAAALQSYATGDATIRGIALAMVNYADSKKAFPVANSAAYFDANGQPFLSWRVHILPYLGETALYNKFHLDEPWNSANNLPLLAEMPDYFRSAGDSADTTTTRMVTFTGPDAPFGYRTAGVNQSGPSIVQITDGTESTIMVAEAGSDKAVTWTKPDDSPFDKNNPLAALGDLSAGKFRVAFFDGHISTFGSDINPAIFSGLVTRNGAERVDSGTVAGRESARAGIPTTGNVMQNRFKNATLAMQNYYDTRRSYPVSGTSVFDSNGYPYLSWRVYLLPFLGYSTLYSKFHLNEPWDSPNNLPLLDEMPSVYRTVGDPWDSVTTRIVEFTGPGAPFLNKPSGSQTPVTQAQITDGMSRTVQLVEAGSGGAVPWTKPSDVAFYPNNPFSPLGDIGPNFIAAFFDAHTEIQLSSESINLLKAYITYNGGEDTRNSQRAGTLRAANRGQHGGQRIRRRLIRRRAR